MDSENPRAAGRDGPAVSETPSGNSVLHWHGDGTLLVVDDDAGVRELMSSLLQRCGFTVLTAGDGQTALDTFRRLADQIRVVILDFGLPDTTGEALLHSMRRIRAELRAILCSGCLTDKDRDLRVTGDWSAVIEKPFGLIPFLQTVRKVLEA
jgi:DNA-binding NtrC family response regulator